MKVQSERIDSVGQALAIVGRKLVVASGTQHVSQIVPAVPRATHSRWANVPGCWLVTLQLLTALPPVLLASGRV